MILDKAFAIFVNYWPMFWYGIKTTILFALVGTLCGLLIGLCLGAIRAMHVEKQDTVMIKTVKMITQTFAKLYVWFFRGTPMMVQAMLFYYGFRPYLHWTPFVAGMVIISVNTGAYMAEIIRSGIQSIDAGQREASRSLGMSAMQTMRYVILPQAIRNSFPSIGNEFIVNIKDSSMLNVIGVIELFFQSTSIAGGNYLFVETFLSTCLLYLLLTSLASWGMAYLEKRMTKQKAPNVKRFREERG